MRRGKRFLKVHLLPILILLFISLIYGNIAQSEEYKLTEEVKAGHLKIESTLFNLKKNYLFYGKTISQGLAQPLDIRMDEQERIIVFILPEAGKTKEWIDMEALKIYGGEVIKSGDAVIKAKVPILMLDQIAEQVKGISFIKLPDKPLADHVSQGVSLTGASFFQTSGVEGQNIKVGVIDLGFAELSSAIASGELPASVVKIDCTDKECVNTDFPSEIEDHGTAVAEVIHDMAPKAQLYLIKVQDYLDLKDAKDYCIANGIKIINHSVGWFNTNFYDGSCYFDNPVCIADHAYKNGILWINAAGNHARKHYGGIFTDSDGDRLHNVTNGSNYITLNAQSGDGIVATLTWDAWPVTDQDYDLLLYDHSMVLVANSFTWQNGTQPPGEIIAYPVTTSGTYYLAVKKYLATSNHKFEIFSFYHDLNPYVASSSLLSPSDANGVIAVAAIDQANWTTGPQENFSSQGPTTDGRMKPDISGPDGVSNSVYGSFFGTSAAAPHVAGAAALILSSSPSFSVSQLWEAIISPAIDMGVSGQDTFYGFGRLNLSTINIYPASADFNSVFIGSSSDEEIAIQNVGSLSLVIQSITSPSFPYSIISDLCSGKTLALGENCKIKIRFSPAAIGTFNSNFNVYSNDPFRNPVPVYLTGKGISEIILTSPADETHFSLCSIYSPPIFWWNNVGTFSGYEIQFSGDAAFNHIPLKVNVSGGTNGKLMEPYFWRQVLLVIKESGGTIYWRVIGRRSNATTVSSDINSIYLSEPEPVVNPTLSSVSKMKPPTLAWQNNCNNVFQAWFGSDPSFSKKRVLTFYWANPALEGGIFSREILTSQWLAIRRLVGDVSGSTIYWYVESWDGFNRYSTTDVMSFILTN